MKNLKKQLQEQFDKMCATGQLYRASVSGTHLWDTYLKGFKEENDPIFRDPESSVHNCNFCNNFIRRYGNVVAIGSDLEMMSLFDIEVEEEYADSIAALRAKVHCVNVKDVFFETYNMLMELEYEKNLKKSNSSFKLGVPSNNKRYTRLEAEAYKRNGEFIVKPNEVRTFNHMSLDLPKEFVSFSNSSIEHIMSVHRDNANVFQRAMLEIPLATLELVRDLIVQGSLLDGDTHLHKVETMIKFAKEYKDIPLPHLTDNWTWKTSRDLPIAKFKNELIGVLCSELAEGEELNKAVKSWNKRVDPANYMKAVAPITETQKKLAQEFVEENYYVESFNRRFAILDDIKADEIKHLNVGDGSIKKVSMFDNVKTKSSIHKRNEFKGIEEVTIEKFMKDILPGCSSVEAFLENKQENNLVTLTTAEENSKPIFKWSNPYSWTYKGNLAGKSMIEQAVKSRGGATDGVLNVRLHFPNSETDYDLCMDEPNGNRIQYRKVRITQASSGRLDLDAQGVDGYYPPEKRVENINYTNINKMPKGSYYVEIDDYGGGTNNGFILEVKTPNGVNRYEFTQPINGKRNRILAIEFDGENFKEYIKHSGLNLVDSEHSSMEVYGLETNKFHKVNLVSLSPNHWGHNNVGNKHYFFMLDGCKIDKPIRSFHAENLLPELAEHRKVLEVLGAMNMIEPSDKQLSGLGFNATVRDEVILRLKGNFKRVIKVKF